MRFGMKEVCDVTFINLLTGKPELYLDTLKMTTVENTAETSYARGGKGNPRILGWDFNRESAITIQDALLSPVGLSMLSGNAIVKGSADIFCREVHTVTASKITLKHTPKTISAIYETTDGYEHGEEVTHSNVEGTVTLTNVEDGDKVIVYYTYESGANTTTVRITSDAFPGYYKIIGDTVVRNEATGKDEPFQLVIPKAKLQANFTLTMQTEGDPAVFDFNLDVFKANDSTNMIEMIQYEEPDE